MPMMVSVSYHVWIIIVPAYDCQGSLPKRTNDNTPVTVRDYREEGSATFEPSEFRNLMILCGKCPCSTLSTNTIASSVAASFC